jgi:uncharacterized protein
MERRIIQSIDMNEVREAIKNSSKESSIYVGCDSQNYKKNTTFGIAIVIHIDSSKGGKLFVEISKTERMKSMRQRLLKEVELAVMTSLELIDVIGDRYFEVHLDVNPNPKHKSNIVCKEAIGYANGQGLNCKIKPEAWCSTHCGDHVAREKLM